MSEAKLARKGTWRHRVFEKGSIPVGGWLWCLHCERAYRYGECRKVARNPDIMAIEKELGEERLTHWDMCPYEGCDGDAVCDSINWEDLREYRPEFPVVPVRGVVYSGN